MRKPVRNFKSNATHLADLSEGQVVPAVAFGAKYTATTAGVKALCNVALTDGIVMKPGSQVTCKTCRMLAQHIQDVEDGADPVPLVEQEVARVLGEHLTGTLKPEKIERIRDDVLAALREIEPS